MCQGKWECRKVYLLLHELLSFQIKTLNLGIILGISKILVPIDNVKFVKQVREVTYPTKISIMWEKIQWDSLFRAHVNWFKQYIYIWDSWFLPSFLICRSFFSVSFETCPNFSRKFSFQTALTLSFSLPYYTISAFPDSPH